MKTPDVVKSRRRNLRAWIDEQHQGSQAEFIRHTGINQGETSALLRDKPFGEKRARAIEEIAGMPAMWLDLDRHGDAGTNMSRLGEEIARRRTQAGWSQKDLAGRSGVPQYRISRYETGAVAKVSDLPELAKAFGVSIETMLSGADAAGESEVAALPTTRLKTKGSYVDVPRLDVAARCGRYGIAPPEDYVLGNISLMKNWLQNTVRDFSSVGALRIIEATGKSMQPTISDGDLLLVDVGINVPNLDGVYILLRDGMAGEEIMIKTVIRHSKGGGLTVKSDNVNYGSEEFTAAEVDQYLRVVGRVVWVFHGEKF